jgi:hypothetical protein
VDCYSGSTIRLGVLGLPVMLTLGILVSVALVTPRGGDAVVWISAVLSVLAGAVALATYYAMARGAYGTYLGFYLTATAGVFALIQRVVAEPDRR